VAALAASVEAVRVQQVTQVHGRAHLVVRAGDDAPAGPPVEADVIVSNAPTVAVAVRAADCVPVLIADQETGAVAAIHAGWRGTCARAAPAAVSALRAEFGARPENLIAAIGPSIGVCCYEVGPELVDAFAAAGHPRHLIDRWFLSPRSRGRVRPVLGGVEGPKLRLDVAGANRDQLTLAGVPDAQIHVAGVCTAMHLEVLTSYRVEKGRAGRLAGAIAPPRSSACAASNFRPGLK
jgi:YfiH family protein